MVEVVQTPYLSYDELNFSQIPDFEENPYTFFDYEHNFSSILEFEQTPSMVYDEQPEFSPVGKVEQFPYMINDQKDFSPIVEFEETPCMIYDDQSEFSLVGEVDEFPYMFDDQKEFLPIQEFDQTPSMIYDDQPEVDELLPIVEFEEALGGKYDQPKKRKTQGKRKIEIKKIEKKTSRQVTFSKRKSGLIRKAEKLCKSDGANVAVVTFSGVGKLFTNPSADVTMQRYVESRNPNFGKIIENNCSYDQSSQQYKEVPNLAEEKNVDYSCGNNGGFWWEKPLDNLGLVELEDLKVAVKGLMGEVDCRIDEMSPSSMMSSVPQVFDYHSLAPNVHQTTLSLSPDAYFNMISS